MGIQPRHRLRQHMGCGVAKDLQFLFKRTVLNCTEMINYFHVADLFSWKLDVTLAPSGFLL